MALMTNNQLDLLLSQAKFLYNQMTRTDKFSISDEEFIQLFIDPTHVETLQQTERLCGAVGTRTFTTTYYFDDRARGYVHVGFFKNPPIIIPQYATTGLHFDAPIELQDRFSAWTKWVRDVHDQFADILDAICWINLEVKSWDAARAILPILPVLLTNINKDPESVNGKRAARLQARPNVQGIPRLPREVKQRLIHCSNTALAATLIPEINYSGNAHFTLRMESGVKKNIFNPHVTSQCP